MRRLARLATALFAVLVLVSGFVPFAGAPLAGAQELEADSPGSREGTPRSKNASPPERAAAPGERASAPDEGAAARETVKKPSRSSDENQREPRQKVKAGASVAFPVDI